MISGLGLERSNTQAYHGKPELDRIKPSQGLAESFANAVKPSRPIGRIEGDGSPNLDEGADLVRTCEDQASHAARSAASMTLKVPPMCTSRMVGHSSSSGIPARCTTLSTLSITSCIASGDRMSTTMASSLSSGSVTGLCQAAELARTPMQEGTDRTPDLASGAGEQNGLVFHSLIPGLREIVRMVRSSA